MIKDNLYLENERESFLNGINHNILLDKYYDDLKNFVFCKFNIEILI